MEKALSYLEEEAGHSRTGHNGVHLTKARLAFATFEHGTSRAQEPQLHTHCVLPNAGVRPDGTTGTLHVAPIYRHKMAAGSLYRAELAHQLRRRLGFELERDPEAKFSFRLKGVNSDLENFFSTRRKEVVGHLEERGLSGASASARMAVLSRSNKDHAPRKDLAKEWARAGECHGFGREELQAIIRPEGERAHENGDVAAYQASREALEALTTHQSTFTEADLIRATAEASQVKGISSEQIIAGAQKTLGNHVIPTGMARQRGKLPAFQPRTGEPRFTTREILDLESGLLEKVEAGIGKCRTSVPRQIVERAIAARPTIGAGQAEAVRHLTTGADQIKTVTGQAGTGKTFMLQVANDAWKEAGFTVEGVAPSAKAARGLSESGIPSGTVHSWLWRAERGRLRVPSVLVMDEAGMADTRIMARVVDQVHRSETTLVCVGDAGQLQAVELGGAFKGMDELLGGGVTLTKIIRQEREADREAVRNLIAGRAQKGALSSVQKRFLS